MSGSAAQSQVSTIFTYLGPSTSKLFGGKRERGNVVVSNKDIFPKG